MSDLSIPREAADWAESWLWISGGIEHGKGDEIVCEDDACTDCVFYLANGDEPESWRAR